MIDDDDDAPTRMPAPVSAILVAEAESESETGFPAIIRPTTKRRRRRPIVLDDGDSDDDILLLSATRPTKRIAAVANEEADAAHLDDNLPQCPRCGEPLEAEMIAEYWETCISLLNELPAARASADRGEATRPMDEQEVTVLTMPKARRKRWVKTAADHKTLQDVLNRLSIGHDEYCKALPRVFKRTGRSIHRLHSAEAAKRCNADCDGGSWQGYQAR